VVTSSVFVGNTAVSVLQAKGAALYLNALTQGATVISSRFVSNTALFTGDKASGAVGGALFTSGTWTLFRAINCTFTANRALALSSTSAIGGAIYVSGVNRADFVRCNVTSNYVYGTGASSAVVVTAFGGGLYVSTTTYVNSSTFTNNSAVQGGTAWSGSSAARGGGAFVSSNTMLRVFGATVFRANYAQTPAGTARGARLLPMGPWRSCPVPWCPGPAPPPRHSTTPSRLPPRPSSPPRRPHR
jgi:hypothetical protein